MLGASKYTDRDEGFDWTGMGWDRDTRYYVGDIALKLLRYDR